MWWPLTPSPPPPDRLNIATELLRKLGFCNIVGKDRHNRDFQKDDYFGNHRGRNPHREVLIAHTKSGFPALTTGSTFNDFPEFSSTLQGHFLRNRTTLPASSNTFPAFAVASEEYHRTSGHNASLW